MSDAAMEKIKSLVDEATGPRKMTQEEAVEFLEDLIGDLQIRLEAIKEDMGG